MLLEERENLKEPSDRTVTGRLVAVQVQALKKIYSLQQTSSDSNELILTRKTRIKGTVLRVISAPQMEQIIRKLHNHLHDKTKKNQKCEIVIYDVLTQIEDESKRKLYGYTDKLIRAVLDTMKCNKRTKKKRKRKTNLLQQNFDRAKKARRFSNWSVRTASQ